MQQAFSSFPHASLMLLVVFLVLLHFPFLLEHALLVRVFKCVLSFYLSFTFEAVFDTCCHTFWVTVLFWVLFYFGYCSILGNLFWEIYFGYCSILGNLFWEIYFGKSILDALF
jgi:hypothetical protein